MLRITRSTRRWSRDRRSPPAAGGTTTTGSTTRSYLLAGHAYGRVHRRGTGFATQIARALLFAATWAADLAGGNAFMRLSRHGAPRHGRRRWRRRTEAIAAKVDSGSTRRDRRGGRSSGRPHRHRAGLRACLYARCGQRCSLSDCARYSRRTSYRRCCFGPVRILRRSTPSPPRSSTTEHRCEPAPGRRSLPRRPHRCAGTGGRDT